MEKYCKSKDKLKTNIYKSYLKVIISFILKLYIVCRKSSIPKKTRWGKDMTGNYRKKILLKNEKKHNYIL